MTERTQVLPLVEADLRARIEKGTREYGEPLTTHNGRDALVDAYEEALDLALYLRQAIEERDRHEFPTRACCYTHATHKQRHFMITCTQCGNKRCPHATDCSLDCTDSNEPGQPGSNYR